MAFVALIGRMRVLLIAAAVAAVVFLALKLAFPVT